MKNSVFLKKSRGVTIIEMTVVIAILSVIFVMLFLSYEFFVKKVKVTKIALETKEYSKSLESFHLIYGGLPGDLASAQKRISASLIDGDGDGRISTEEEQFQVWPHLSEAKMLEKSGGGKYVGLPTNNTPLLGTHLPYIRNSDNLAVGVVFNTPSGYRANSFIVGGLNGREVARPVLTQAEIQMGDQKYDDGFATSGSWMCGTNPPASVCNYSNSAQQNDNFMLYLPFTRTLSSSSSTSCPPQSLQIGTLVANIPEVAPSGSYTGNCR
ncbi:MAG: prepilin-type N-terminal cleavage/methylation domain-containing protein, partial [Proteobacteria bacterium]|nr:prepilin-type N-terminal cleavage/methylation domain-containing protein [Pseudomonadota bacterium]